MTCDIAANRKPRAIIFQSGFRSLPSIAKDIISPLKLMPGFIFPEPRLDNEKLLQGEHAPLLIMHGKNDEVIPFKHAELIFEKASEPKTFVALNSRHNDTYVVDADAYDRSVRDFMSQVDSTKQK